MRNLVALLALLTVVTTGCSSLDGTGDKGFISQDGAVTQIPAADRGEAIDVTGEDLDGKQISFADLRGGVVVVNVWGAWCTPCRVEQPDLNEAAEQTAGAAEFVGLNIRDASVDNARAFVRTNEVPYPSIYDPDSKALLDFSAVHPVRSPPTTFVLDREGRVAAVVSGRLPSVGTLVTLVEDVDNESRGTTGG
ncbi:MULTISPECIES: TlpA family protein disulfide reductase [Nocardioides]|uniref:TlpA family protein disulfide reductase n=1 Tax=Nocardioides TaxID=1839 RepID=UPI00032E9828|nr:MULTISPECIES: TlpA disulfide reductase family protein [Nocardioides]EON25399.1 redoxin domain-containing protein [Nocardioides sp. CF8]